jgi:uncharacterized heparinase superfamily protein
MRGEDAYLIVDAGGTGQNGTGGHAHNDLLSFELFSNGHSWIIDPGTYVYTSNYDDRYLLRSTAYHNTIRIDSEEINRFDTDKLFCYLDDAPVRIHHWITDENIVFFDAEHHGYCRLTTPVIHRRQILLDRRFSHFLLRDQLLGRGTHLIEANFHLSPEEYQIQYFDPVSIRLTHPKGVALTIFPLARENLELAISEGWVSKSYGRRQSAQILTYHQKTKAPVDVVTLFYNQSSIEPVETGSLHKLGAELLLKLNVLQAE